MCKSCGHKREFVVNYLIGNDRYEEKDRVVWEKCNHEERVRRLREVGYIAATNPNKRFRRVFEEGVAFYGIGYQDGCPEWFLTFKRSKRCERWRAGRRFREEKRRLQDAKIPFSCMYYYPEDWEDCDSFPDGYCRRCKMDLQRDDDLCRLCRTVEGCKASISQKILDGALCQPFPFLMDGALCYRCAACMEPVRVEKKCTHHISYFPPKLCATHRTCHTIIHRTKRHPDLRPPDGDAERFYQQSTSRARTACRSPRRGGRRRSC